MATSSLFDFFFIYNEPGTKGGLLQSRVHSSAITGRVFFAPPMVRKNAALKRDIAKKVCEIIALNKSLGPNNKIPRHTVFLFFLNKKGAIKKIRIDSCSQKCRA
jgi:hypothetical protein